MPSVVCCVNAKAHLDPCSRFSFTTTSFAMSLHAGMAASLTAEQVLFSIMLPMGLVMALASLMPWEDPEASTTASKACMPHWRVVDAHAPAIASVGPAQAPPDAMSCCWQARWPPQKSAWPFQQALPQL